MGKVFEALSKTTAGDRESGKQDVEGFDFNRNGLDKGLESEPNFPALGKIPDSAGAQTVGASPQEAVAVHGMEQWDERLLTFADPSTPLSENFRRLRSKILHPPSGKPLKKIMLVSASPGAGKSFVCANLGISIAQGLEQHALVVDCDLRRPSLAALFGIENSLGMSNYLQDGMDIGPLIQKTGMRKLSIIPSGPRTVNPAELLGSGKVGQLFDELNSRYDDRFVIIDSPPLQAASETAILARHVDAVIPVIRWGAGSRTLIRQQLEAIDPQKILGVIFNAYQSNFIGTKLSGYDAYGTYSSN